MTRKIKVAHVTSLHPRDDMRIFHKECRSLAAAGYDVTLVVADGLGNAVSEGIDVVDVGNPSFGLRRRFMKSRLLWALLSRSDFDVVHFHDPELLIVGYLLRRKDYTVIFDCHEIVPLQMANNIRRFGWFGRTIIPRIYRLIERFVARRLDAVIVVQESMTRLFPFAKTTVVVENFALDAALANEATTSHPPVEQGLKLVYAGANSAHRGFFNMLDLASLLRDGETFIVAGNAPPQLIEQAKAHPAWHKIEFLGRITPAQVASCYERSNVGVILYNNVGQYGLSYAVKLFEFMARGLPVIMPSHGEWAAFNARNECGICVDVDDIKQYEAALNTIRQGGPAIERMRQNGREAVRERYSWSAAEKALLALYEKLTAGLRGARAQ